LSHAFLHGPVHGSSDSQAQRRLLPRPDSPVMHANGWLPDRLIMKFPTPSCSQEPQEARIRGSPRAPGADGSRRFAIYAGRRLLRTGENIACVQLRPINLSCLCPHQKPHSVLQVAEGQWPTADRRPQMHAAGAGPAAGTQSHSPHQLYCWTCSSHNSVSGGLSP
jgi:hypothetical protein